MGLKILDKLKHGPIALDTVIVIYFIEEHPDYIETLTPLFESIAEGRIKAVTSALTLLETLIIPLRTNNLSLAEQYEAILTHSHNFELVELTLPILRIAALIRATTKARTPDAIQLAAATHANCTIFLTNDRDIPSVDGIEVIQLTNWP